MTQEQKELLIKDLSTRLPYGVKIKDLSTQADTTIDVLGIKKPFIIVDEYSRFGNVYDSISVEFVKPYLRPMSSMSEEEHRELSKLVNDDKLLTGDPGKTVCLHCGVVIDFFNSHHLDWRGLIEKGLALEAPEDMYD